ncbi:MAG TPA: GNAT family N-acetyltransferase [Thermoanaerobaculia bacterium]|nr:GNAT family N-acetyltransferase [Thermoanaerobaculia bacterium]
MSATVRIRPGGTGDAAAIVDFQLRMARETEDLELDRDTVVRGVAAVFADPTKGSYWVAERQDRPGEVVGSLLTTFEWSDWRDGTVLWIQSVYVVPEERGRGVYRALYEHLKRRAEDDPALMGIRLYVDRRNAAAQGVYERLGMSREHYEMFEWLK